MRKVLILGAMGFIGKNILHTLEPLYELIAYDRKGAFDNFPINNIICYEGDFKTEARWAEILEGVDCVIHLVSTTNVNSKTENIEEEIKENVLPTIKLLESMVFNHVKKLLFISSGGTVYGITSKHPIIESTPLFPICPYGVQKKTIESYLTLYNYLYGMENIILRVSNPYGLGQDVKRTQGIIPIFINNAINKRPITVWGNGENIRDYIYMDDLMQAILRILNYHGNHAIFNVGSGVGHSINDIIGIIREELNINNLKVEYLPARAMDVPVNILDNHLLKQETGWSPKVTLQAGVKLLYQKMQDCL